MKQGYIEFMAAATAEGKWARRERPQAVQKEKPGTTWRDLGSTLP